MYHTGSVQFPDSLLIIVGLVTISLGTGVSCLRTKSRPAFARIHEIAPTTPTLYIRELPQTKQAARNKANTHFLLKSF